MKPTDKTLTAADEDALKRCLVQPAPEPRPPQEVDSMLADETRSWQEVAVFAAQVARAAV